MKSLLTILLLSSIFCFGQFDLKIQIKDPATDQPIPHCLVSLKDYVNGSTDFEGNLILKNLPVEKLEDTLRVEHLNYSFYHKPIIEHDYQFNGKQLIIEVPALYQAQVKYEIELPIAQSKKVKNDSIELVFYAEDDQGMSIPVHLKKNQKNLLARSSKEFHNQYIIKVPYDEITDGFIASTVSETSIASHYLFEANDWTCLNYLMYFPYYIRDDREIKILQAYYRDLNELKEIHKGQISELIEQIDSLNQVIFELKNPETPYITEEPVRPYPEEIIVFPLIHARPPGGAQFFEQIKNRYLAGLEVKYAGNITLKLTIKKDGSVKVKTLHKAIGTEEVESLLRQKLSEFKWYPAELVGRKYEQEIILTIEIIPA